MTEPPRAAYGFRRHLPAGPAVRFAPGKRIVYGGNGLIAGQLADAGKKQQALGKLL